MEAALLARRGGNEGRARVCARRACGAALTWFASRFPRPAWGNDALKQLIGVTLDSSFPPPVREAASRLSTRVSNQFSYQFATDPIEDAKLIIAHIQQQMASHDR